MADLTKEEENYKYFVECYMRWATKERPKSYDYFYKLAILSGNDRLMEDVANYRFYEWSDYIAARDMYIDCMKKKYGRGWKLGGL